MAQPTDDNQNIPDPNQPENAGEGQKPNLDELLGTKEEQTYHKQRRMALSKTLTRLGVIVLIAIGVNFLAQQFFTRIDLTADKRYTLSQVTKNKITGLDKPVSISIYMDGDNLRDDIAYLRDRTRELLDQLKGLNSNNVQYQFVNIDRMDGQQRKNLIEQMGGKGLEAIVVTDKGQTEVMAKQVLPGGLMIYNGKEVAFQLYEQGGDADAQALENATIGLEYELMNALSKAMSEKKKKVAILQGHGELQPIEMADIDGTLSQFYQVDYVRLPEYKVGRLDDYDAVIIAKPDSTFDELEKYKIDQYVMKGGKVVWCIDALYAPLDSIGRGPSTTTDYNLNIINDMLYTYGARVNLDLVADANCNFIQLIDRSGAGQGMIPYPWPYFPLVQSPTSGGHPIVNNLSPIWLQFAGSIDTIKGKKQANVQMTPLLQSSPNTKVYLNPVSLSLSQAVTMKRDVQKGMYRQGVKTFALLLEGKFESNFANRPPSPASLATGEYGEFKEESKPTKMIVISDGDIIRNDVDRASKRPYRLGFDRNTGKIYGNKAFVQNCVDYLLDDEGLLALRSKDIRVRPLDQAKAEREKNAIRIQNIGVPLTLVLLAGIVFHYLRRRRYAA